MYSSKDTAFRPKRAVLTWQGQLGYLVQRFSPYFYAEKAPMTFISEPKPINPSASIGDLTNDEVEEYILDNEEIEEDTIIAQKISSNRHQVTKALQTKFDEWEKGNDETGSDIYYDCGVAISEP